MIFQALCNKKEEKNDGPSLGQTYYRFPEINLNINLKITLKYEEKCYLHMYALILHLQ